MIEARDFRTPNELAVHLSRYVSCPSSIVAGTANHFGKSRAVSREQAQRLIDKRREEEARRKRIAQHTSKGDASRDGIDFDPRRHKPKIAAVPAKRTVEWTPPAPNASPWPKWFKPHGQRLPADMLIRRVAQAFNLTAADLVGKERRGDIVGARAVVARILRDRNISYPTIGRLMGGRDHSTIVNCIAKFSIYERRDPRVLQAYVQFKDGGSLEG